MSIPSHVRLEEPWQALPIDQVTMLTSQLQRELPAGHVLSGVETRAIARTANRDDVLFELLDHDKRLAVVHLTWSQQAQTDSRWPDTCLFATWDEWVRERLIPDCAEFRE